MATVRYTNLAGGMNTAVSNFLMEDGECWLIKNGELQVVGAIVKVSGYAQRGTTLGTSDVLGLTYYYQASGARTQIATYSSTIYYYDSGTSDWIAYTGAGAGLTADKKMEFVTFLDSLFAFNGEDSNRVLVDGSWSTSSYVAGSPIGSLAHVWQEKVYIAGNASKKNRAWESDPPEGKKLTWGWATGTNGATTSGQATFTSTGATFKTNNIKVGDTLRVTSGTNAKDYVVRSIGSETQLTVTENFANTASNQAYEVGSNWFNVGEDDGDIITGFGDNADRLLIFKGNSLYRWDGSNLMKAAPVGTYAHRSVVNIDSWTFFANQKGIWAYDGANVQFVSRKLSEWFSAVSQDTLADMVAWADGSVYKVYIGDVTVNDKAYSNVVVAYDIAQNICWITEQPHKIQCVNDFIESGVNKAFFGTDDGEIFELGSGLVHDDTAIEMNIATKAYHFGKPELAKMVKAVTVFCNEAEGTQLYIVPDDKDPVSLGQLQQSTTTVTCNVVGNRFQLLLSHGSTSTKPTIEGFAFEYETIEE